jgi:hypothetical protein
LSMDDYREAVRIISENGHLVFFRGDPISAGRISEAEVALGVALPPTYRQFLRDFGTLLFEGKEFRGIKESGSITDPSSHMVWLTLEFRNDGLIPPEMIVVGEDGMGNIDVIDIRIRNDEGESPVVYWSPGLPESAGEPEQLGEDFGDYFHRQIEEAIGWSESP